jgi:hypothetical protein
VPTLLPVPPPVELSRALGEASPVEDVLAVGEEEASGEWEAVVDCERKVSVARREAETLSDAGAEAELLAEAEREAVGERVRTVSVAAAEAVPTSGVAVLWLLAVPSGEGLGSALKEVEGVAVLVAAALLVPFQKVGLCEALGQAEAVAMMVGGMKVSEGDTVGECVRRVSVAWTVAETLGQEVWETVGVRERTVSVAAGECEPALTLAVPRALPLPPSMVGLSRALGEAEGVPRVVGGRKEKEGVKVAVVDCERRVNVASTVAEWEAVEDCERAVTVAAGVADPGMELPELWGLPVPPREGLREALGQLLAVEVPEADEQPEDLCELTVVALLATVALPTTELGEALLVVLAEAHTVAVRVAEAGAEGMVLTVALKHCVGEEESENANTNGALLPEAVVQRVALGEAAPEGKGDAERDGMGETLPEEQIVALGEGEPRCVGGAVGERVRETVPQAVGERVPKGLTEVGVTVPGEEQVAGLAQAAQVALLVAPVAALAVPAGQAMAFTEESGQ